MGRYGGNLKCITCYSFDIRNLLHNFVFRQINVRHDLMSSGLKGGSV
jgi:hypothetical protein